MNHLTDEAPVLYFFIKTKSSWKQKNRPFLNPKWILAKSSCWNRTLLVMEGQLFSSNPMHCKSTGFHGLDTQRLPKEFEAWSFLLSFPIKNRLTLQFFKPFRLSLQNTPVAEGKINSIEYLSCPTSCFENVHESLIKANEESCIRAKFKSKPFKYSVKHTHFKMDSLNIEFKPMKTENKNSLDITKHSPGSLQAVLYIGAQKLSRGALCWSSLMLI